MLYSFNPQMTRIYIYESLVKINAKYRKNKEFGSKIFNINVISISKRRLDLTAAKTGTFR